VRSVIGLWLVSCLTSSFADEAHPLPASGETVPVESAGDAADDPAIWVHPTAPDKSLVLGTDKQRGMGVYDLQGKLLSFVADGELNNVDIRTGFPLGGESVDIAATTNRTSNTIAIYRIHGESGTLTSVAVRPLKLSFDVYGCCLYKRASAATFYVFVNAKDGTVEQWELFATPENLIDAKKVRAFSVGGQVEGCVADDALGFLYVGEEDAAIWKYPANPETEVDDDGEVEPLERDLVDVRTPWGNIEPDVEGLTLVATGVNSGYLIASSQGSNAFLVYSREGNNAYRGAFRISASPTTDEVTGTDGIDVSTANLGSSYPHGVFVAQDDEDDGGSQNFNLVRWDAIIDTLNENPAATLR
jgi:3-phytase